MSSSDTEFFITLMIGFVWGWIVKAITVWGREMERRERDEREARQRLRRHPSWADHE